MKNRGAWLVVVVGLLGGGLGASGQVVGKAVWEGAVPQPRAKNAAVNVPGVAAPVPPPDERVVLGPKNELANVVVYVKNGAKLGGAVPNEPAVIGVKGAAYVPHVVPVMVGQDIRVRNGDNTMHVPNGLGKANPAFEVNLLQQGVAERVDGARAVETYRLACRVHPWMRAWVVVLDHPYFAVTKADGTFVIKGLPAGKHTLVAWQEVAGEREAEVEVGADGKVVKEPTFTLGLKK